MTTRPFALGIGVFALVLAVILGVAAIGPEIVQSDDTRNPSPDVPDAFASDGVTLETSTAQGTVTVDAQSTGDTVVIDTAHGNDQTTEQVQTLERLLVENGYHVRYHGEERNGATGSAVGGFVARPAADGAVASSRVRAQSGGVSPGTEQSPMNESLRGAEAYVIVNPSTRYDRADAKSVETFANGGGRVLIVSDPSSLSIAELLVRSLGAPSSGSTDSLAPMSSRFGVGVDSGYLYQMTEYDGNYQTIYASGASGDLAEGVDRVSVHRAAPVFAGPKATVTLETGPRTEHSDSGRADEYAIAARQENVSIVGDTSVLDPARLHHADNEIFVGNLVEFLVSGNVRSDLFAPSNTEKQPTNHPREATPPGNTTASP
jgi:hypothetical protein